MPKWIDLPPIWLIVMMAVMYVDATMIAPAPNWPMPWLGGAVIAMAVGLMIWAALSFRAQKTTIVPHQAPTSMITSGPFAYSRNPIYLADVIVLAGWGVILGAALPFLVVVIFIWIIKVRFIDHEEARLHETFGEDFVAYKSRVRRWI